MLIFYGNCLGDRNEVKALIKNVTNINALTLDGRTLLVDAATNGNLIVSRK